MRRSNLTDGVAGGGVGLRQESVRVAEAARSSPMQHQRHAAKFSVCLSYFPLGATLATGFLGRFVQIIVLSPTRCLLKVNDL